jgi:hypothetical protein
MVKFEIRIIKGITYIVLETAKLLNEHKANFQNFNNSKW